MLELKKKKKKKKNGGESRPTPQPKLFTWQEEARAISRTLIEGRIIGVYRQNAFVRNIKAIKAIKLKPARTDAKRRER